MSYSFVKVEREAHVTLVTINRPEVMNALHPPAQQELDRVFDDFQSDPQQWIAIVTGAGDKAFSAGNDLKFQAEHGSAATMMSHESTISNPPPSAKPFTAAITGL